MASPPCTQGVAGAFCETYPPAYVSKSTMLSAMNVVIIRIKLVISWIYQTYVELLEFLSFALLMRIGVGRIPHQLAGFLQKPIYGDQ